MWKTTNALGLEVTWYSEEEVKELLKKIDILEENTKFVKSNKYGFFYEKDIDNLIESKLETINQSCKNYKEILKLQAENEKIKTALKFRDSNIDAKNKEIIRKCKNNRELIDKNWKLIKTLTEIKEIVKPHQRNIDKICGHCRRYDGCHACCIDDINCYQYKKPTTPACDKYCELKEFEINKIANQILQKISEVLE